MAFIIYTLTKAEKMEIEFERPTIMAFGGEGDGENGDEKDLDTGNE